MQPSIQPLPNIQLHIERLILEGIDLPQAQRPLMQAALEAELTRLLSEQGLEPSWHKGGVVSRLESGVTPPLNGSNPIQMGQQIAQAVYQGMAQKGER